VPRDLRQTEIKNVRDDVFVLTVGEEDVFRLEIAMDDPLGVRQLHT